MAKTYKIVFAGPVGAGKTSAVAALSDIEVLSTEAQASDGVKAHKAQTTVAMDYGVMNLADGDRVRLYGTPGQERFDFMWEILSHNALGVVLLLDASAPDPLSDLRAYAAAFRAIIDQTSLVVGLTHNSWDNRAMRGAVGAELTRLRLPAAVMNTDARKRSDLAMLVKTLLFSLDPLHEAH